MQRLAYFLLAVVPACASNDGVEISDEEYDDVALSIGSTTATHGGGGEIGAMSDVMNLVGGVMPHGFFVGEHGELSGDHLGIAYRYELSCADAAGHALATCDRGADSADVHVSWSGLLDVPFLRIAIDREGDWELRELATSTPTLQGDGHMTYETAVNDPDRGSRTTYRFGYDAVYDGVQLTDRPIAGTIHYVVAADRTRTTTNHSDTRSFDVDARITFAADGPSELELDGTRSYDLDVTSGAIVRRSR